MAKTTEKVSDFVRKLQTKESFGPFVFANRYDGLDLPGKSCKLLILDGLPRLTSEFDAYLATAFKGSIVLESTVAQRIEQGIGRGARGAGDHCVVVLTGRDLVSWVSRTPNHPLLTSSTRAQLEMGREVSRNISDLSDLIDTIIKCLDRDPGWTSYHAQRLAEITQDQTTSADQLELARVELRAYALIRDGHYEKAITTTTKLADDEKKFDGHTRGWLYQLAARAAHCWGNSALWRKHQQDAYSRNRNLLRPSDEVDYSLLPTPGPQAEAMIRRIDPFSPRRSYLTQLEELASQLVAEASANQFEEAVKNLGEMLGFNAERPEDVYGLGPDVLWIMPDKHAWVIEAKSRKNKSKPLSKDEFGQLLSSVEWFKEKYKGYSHVGVSIIPSALGSKSISPDAARALNLTNLQRLVDSLRVVLTELCDAAVTSAQLIARCEDLLKRHQLRSCDLGTYLTPFKIA